MANSTRRPGTQTNKQREQIISKLLDHYQRGQKSLQQHPKRAAYGTSGEKLRKARLFAGRVSQVELNRLIKRCRTHEWAIGTTAIDRLCTVHSRRERSALALEAIKFKWSCADLEREIRKRYGSRSRVAGLGRRPHEPAEVEDALSDLVGLTMRFTRWAAMMQPPAETAAERATVDDLPKPVREHLSKVIPEIEQLQQAAERTANDRRK